VEFTHFLYNDFQIVDIMLEIKKEKTRTGLLLMDYLLSASRQEAQTSCSL
jgi:hypothetical protein